MTSTANKPDPAPSKSATGDSPGTKGGSSTIGEAPPSDPKETDDERALVSSLVRKTRAGDREAYRQLVERYQKRVYAVLFGMLRSREDAMEVSQEVFVKVFTRIGEFEEKSSFYTWIYRVAVNLAIDFRRREWKKVHAVFDESIEDQGIEEATFYRPDRTTPEQAMQSRELGEQIRAALETLPEEQRAVLVMREVDGMSYQEMADVMRCSIGTIMSRLFYARKKMQASLKALERKS